MKLISVFAFTLMASVFPALAQAAPVLTCKSFDVVEGWNSSPTRDHLILTADVESDRTLKNAVISGAYDAQADVVEADPNYKPVAKRYMNHSRFSALEDAWHWFRAVLPKDLITRTKTFRGFIQIHDEQGYKETVALRCSLR